jgi:hypothetical protein
MARDKVDVAKRMVDAYNLRDVDGAFAETRRATGLRATDLDGAGDPCAGLAMLRFADEAQAEEAWPAMRTHPLGLVAQFIRDSGISP